MPAATSSPETVRLTGIVVELHPKSGDNWSRAKIQQANGRTAWVTAKFRLEKGETFDAQCNYNEKYKSYDCVSIAAGENGQVSNEVIILKLREVLDGVGKVKAARLGEQFPNLYEVLVNEPEKIVAACGVSPAAVARVSESLKGEQSTLARVTTLVNKGFPHHLAKRIAKDDKQYVTAVRSPYEAIKLVDGLGWLLADEIGRKQGIELDDQNRIAAGVEYFYLDKVTGNGNTIVHEDALLCTEGLPNLLGVRAAGIVEILNNTLVPRGDGRYTSKRHLDNAETICGFFLSSSGGEGE